MKCSVAGCDRTDIQGKGWCRMHYHRWYRTGTVGEAGRKIRTERGICTIDGCDKGDDGPHGLCRMHTTRLKRHGDPHTVIAVDQRKKRFGPDHPLWREAPSYGTAHHRTLRRRGRASNHDCVECGKQAEHWAYDHSDPNELRGTVKKSPSLMPYSADPKHYQPMCAKCHKQMDIVRDRGARQFELALAG
ncbi:hypothetical protein H7J93_23155 [Mycobacterium barrassiae]|uniref:hypothetical protein n=1 Tax=Mycobacterium barrassiae TaxID=319709 RepID=UPI00226584D4|nr:hypothetical protein [Mycobacterium barrassiae]MCV7302529.1 hypothetical protein [Mycobacterium barrassiae]